MPTPHAKATHRCSYALLGLAISVLGISCAGDSNDPGEDFANGSRTTVVDGREVFVAEHPPCDDTSSCSWSIVIDGVSFEPSGDCVVDPPDPRDLIAIGDEDVGGTRFLGRDSDVLVEGSAVDGSTACSWMVLKTRHRPATHGAPGQ